MASPPNPDAPMARALVARAAYLVAITAIARLGTSLYLPSLPSMGLDIHLSAHQLASTMTAYLAAFALASIVLGPLSDRWGRQPLVQAGLASYLVGSLCCGMANGLGVLLAGRILQAVGGGAVQVATRAMARDAFNDRQMIGIIGWMGLVTGVVPVLAPILGGFVTQSLGWRMNFHLLAATTLLVGVATLSFAAETLPKDKRVPFRILGTLRTYASMLASPSFILPVLPLMLCFAIQGAYLVAAPFVFIHLMGMAPAAFGSTSLALIAAMLAGRFLCVAMLKRWKAYPVYLAGTALAFAGGFLLLAVNALETIGPIPLLGASAMFCLGFGTLLPIGMRAGLSSFPNRVGASSALLGCLTLGSTAAGSAVIGAMLRQTPRDILSMGAFSFVLAALALSFGLFCRKPLSSDS